MTVIVDQNNFADWMKTAGLRNIDLASELGISTAMVSYVSNCYVGKRFGTETCKILAEKFGIVIEWICPYKYQPRSHRSDIPCQK